MYARQQCIARASACRDKAQSNPDQYDYWIDEAVIWLQRAIEAGQQAPPAHEVDDGHLILNQSQQA